MTKQKQEKVSEKKAVTWKAVDPPKFIVARDTPNLKVIELTCAPEKIPMISPDTLFQNLIHPLSEGEFYNSIYTKKALVIRCTQDSQRGRFKKLIKNYLYDLNLKRLVKNTSSDAIHVWEAKNLAKKDHKEFSI